MATPSQLVTPEWTFAKFESLQPEPCLSHTGYKTVKGELSTNVADVSTLAETVNSTLASRITTLESNAAEPYSV